jgi:fluoride exporter
MPERSNPVTRGRSGQLVDPDVTLRDHPSPAGSLRRMVVERGDVLLTIAAGGAIGSVARWAVGHALPHRPGELAVATVAVNVVGALALGVLMVFILEVWPPTRLVRPFLGVGVLGGFTTFSTYALDTTDLLRLGRPATAAVYLFGTLLVGLLASWAGLVGTQAVVEWRHDRRLSHGERTSQEGQKP